jgi:hypothetical protein
MRLPTTRREFLQVIQCLGGVCAFSGLAGVVRAECKTAAGEVKPVCPQPGRSDCIQVEETDSDGCPLPDRFSFVRRGMKLENLFPGSESPWRK